MADLLTSDKDSVKPRLVVLPKDSKLHDEDVVALRSAGFLVIYVKDPKQVRLISNELPPIETNLMLKASLQAFKTLTGSWADTAKARAWDALATALLNEVEPS